MTELLARVYCPTSEDWHPSITGDYHEGGLVEVRWTQDGASLYRVCVMGGDDTGMEWSHWSRPITHAVFMRLCLCLDITRELLTSMCFGRAK